MMNSEDIVGNSPKRSSRSRSSGNSSRRSSSKRKSHHDRHSRSNNKTAGRNSSSSRSPNRSELRQSKRSKEDQEAKEIARAHGVIDHTGTVQEPAPIEGGRRSGRGNRPSRRNQQERGIAKATDLMHRSNTEANVGPMPGSHAASRGNPDEDNKKTGKERFRQPLGTQSVFAEEERVRTETENTGDTVENEVFMDRVVNLTATTVEEEDCGDGKEANAEEAALAGNNTRIMATDVNSGASNKNKKKKKKDRGQSEESNETDWERIKQKKSAQFCFFLLCIFVILGVTLGTWIALRDKPDEPSQVDGVPITQSNITDVPPVNGSVQPTPNPTTIANPPTSPPSGSPSTDLLEVQFDPPSAEDCAAIANGEPRCNACAKIPAQARCHSVSSHGSKLLSRYH